VQKARDETGGLSLFVRSLIGLERNAAVVSMSEFLNDSAAVASQITFVKLIVECLTNANGVCDSLSRKNE
jgi:type I restriction enzyme, R subunit